MSYKPTEPVLCCIPARFHSTRLPGKCLKLVGTKTVIEHVWDKVKQCKLIDEAIVLTDCQQVVDAVNAFGGRAAIISQPCVNGTDRIVHYLQSLSCIPSFIVNVQGDEPVIDPASVDVCIQTYLQHYHNPNVCCGTIHYTTQDPALISTPTKGKLVHNQNGRILYCSRTPIPVTKQGDLVDGHRYCIHIGVFVFRTRYLLDHYQRENTPLQLSEDIEWLKIIEQGFQIVTQEVPRSAPGVDTAADLHSVRLMHASQTHQDDSPPNQPPSPSAPPSHTKPPDCHK